MPMFFANFGWFCCVTKTWLMRKKLKVFREVYHKLSSNLAYMYVYTWEKNYFEMCQLNEIVLQMYQLLLYCSWHEFLIQEALSLNIANMIKGSLFTTWECTRLSRLSSEVVNMINFISRKISPSPGREKSFSKIYSNQWQELD